MRVKTFTSFLTFFLGAALLLALATTITPTTAVDTTTTNADPAVGSTAPEISLEELEKIRASKPAETFTYETEVNRIMKILIHSLYKAKEIFLRELISNASDALDKIRFLSLTDQSALKGNPEMKITIKADPKANTLTITDSGIGMTKHDLRANLGTIAKSGTSEFLAALERNTTDVGLIGQFGVGFYSVFLVADHVTVISKHNDDKQHIWESDAANSFSIIEDPRGDTLGRGTQIILRLKSDATEYLKSERLKVLVRKYSEFINFPIQVWSNITLTNEVPLTEEEVEKEFEKAKAKEKADKKAKKDAEKAKKEKAKKDEDNEVESVDEDEEDEVDEEKLREKLPKTKKVSHNITDYELVNRNKPLWTRNPKEINRTEYFSFYRTVFREVNDPISYTHFRGEGEINFKSILFIPGKAPSDLYQTAESVIRNMRLFVRRVFISDELLDFMPRYLNFLKGMIDSDDLELNVSRETIQQSSLLKIISKKVANKAIEMFRDLTKDHDAYMNFYNEFGGSLKLGVVENDKYKKKLVELLRFHSSYFKDSKQMKNMTSLEDYVSRMKKNQPQIYFITAPSLNECKSSPLVERVLKRGFEVLYMKDPIDEYLIAVLTEYQGKKLHNVAKDGLDLGEGDKVKEYEKQLEEKFKPLTDWIKELLKDRVEKAQVSRRLTDSPVAVVAQGWGWTGSTERMMKAQALSDSTENMLSDFYASAKKIFEVNPYHPIIKNLLNRVNAVKGDFIELVPLIEVMDVLYETAMLKSGYGVKNLKVFATRIEKVVRQNLGIKLDEGIEHEVLPSELDEIEGAVEEEKDNANAKQKEEEKEDEEDDVADGNDHDEL